MLFRGPTKKKFAIIVVLVAFFAILIPIASVHADDGLVNTVADLGTSILVYGIQLFGGWLSALISIRWR